MTESAASHSDKKVTFSKDVVFIEHKYQLMQTPYNFRLNQNLLNRTLSIANKVKKSMQKEISKKDNRHKPYNLRKLKKPLKDITNVEINTQSN